METYDDNYNHHMCYRDYQAAGAIMQIITYVNNSIAETEISAIGINNHWVFTGFEWIQVTK